MCSLTLLIRYIYSATSRQANPKDRRTERMENTVQYRECWECQRAQGVTTHARAHAHARSCTCVRTQTHTHMRAPTRTCTLMHMRAHTNTHAHTHAHAHKHTHAHAHKHTHMRTHTHAHTHMRTYIHMRTHTHTHTHARTCTCVRTHAHPHTHTHADAHTHKHTHSFSPLWHHNYLKTKRSLNIRFYAWVFHLDRRENCFTHKICHAVSSFFSVSSFMPALKNIMFGDSLRIQTKINAIFFLKSKCI